MVVGEAKESYLFVAVSEVGLLPQTVYLPQYHTIAPHIRLRCKPPIHNALW